MKTWRLENGPPAIIYWRRMRSLLLLSNLERGEVGFRFYTVCGQRSRDTLLLAESVSLECLNCGGRVADWHTFATNLHLPETSCICTSPYRVVSLVIYRNSLGQFLRIMICTKKNRCAWFNFMWENIITSSKNSLAIYYISKCFNFGISFSSGPPRLLPAWRFQRYT